MDSFKSLPTSTKVLLVINIAFFGIAAFYPSFRDLLALHYFGSPLFMPHQIVTHLFMHGGLAHLLFNMYALYMFGGVIEKNIGAKRFNLLYFASAIGAFLLHMGVVWYQLLDLPEEIVKTVTTEGAELLLSGRNYADEVLGAANIQYNQGMVGASGALMGVLAAFAMLFPNAKLQLIFIPFPLKAKYFMPIYMGLELFLGVSNFSWDNIAHFAHIGGAIVGLVMMYFWIQAAKRRRAKANRGN